MHYSSIILGLAAAAAAIDIRHYDNESHCNGGVWMQCTNIAANTCCSGSNAHRTASIGFSAIPSNWKVVTRSYDHVSLTCSGDRLLHEFNSNGATSTCHGAPNAGATYGGGGYSFINGKRGAAASCVKPDTLVKDGQKYAISDLDEDTLAQLVRFFLSLKG
jgi:hypothetical protein